MIKRLLFITLLLQLTFLVKSQTVNPNFIDGIVQFKLNDNSLLELDPYTNNVPALNLIFTLYGVDTLYKPFKLSGTPLDKVYRIEFSNVTMVEDLIDDLELIPDVEFAEKSPLYKITQTPNDFNTANQWALTKINAEQAWDFTTGSANVVIAIVDNGVKHSHEDLIGNRWVNSSEQGGLPALDDDFNGYTDDIYGYDIADSDNDPEPPSNIDNSSAFFHGTHVAGIAAAATNNGTGIASLGYNCKFMSVKCSRNSSDGQSLTNAQDGIFYAMRSGADIINMSFASPENAGVTELIVNQATSSGVVLIGAAGNDNSDSEHYPGAYANVLCVGATDENDHKAGFSNYGSWVDVMAPGTGIYSTMPVGGNTYDYKQGTSMATPLVSGLAGLVLAANSGYSPTQVKNKIIGGCINIDNLNSGLAGQLGAGRINAWHTFSAVGIAEDGNTQIGIYPNPVDENGFLNFKFNQALKESIALTITDVSGRLVVSQNIGNPGDKTIELPLDNLSDGLYIASFDINGIHYQEKLIIR